MYACKTTKEREKVGLCYSGLLIGYVLVPTQYTPLVYL